MPPTTSYRRGEVVLVPFPFTDLSSAKQRPALVVSPDGWNASQSDVLLVALTSQIPVPLPAGDVLLSPDDLRTGGLPKATLARPTKLITIHQALIRRSLGQVSEPTLKNVLSTLRSFLT
jgi:mRNA interferase MazF